MRVFRPGDRGPGVHDIQQRIVAWGGSIDQSELDGTYGPSTEVAIRAFQEARNLQVDGMVGPDTWGQLVEAGYALGDRALYLRSPLHRGDDVRALQRKLNALGFDAGKEDGLFGPRIDRAVREFQRNVGQDPDGIVGNDTLTLLDRMRPSESAPSRAVVRETEALRIMRATSVVGQIVAIDPGARMSQDAGFSRAVAISLAQRLTRLGARPILLPVLDEGQDPSDRWRVANERGAALCLSVQAAGTEPGSTGPASSYFGTKTTHSPAGLELARLVLEELQDELGTPGRLQPLTTAILRETRMPAVQVEPFGAADGPRWLGDSALADRVARAVAVAVRRFFAD